MKKILLILALISCSAMAKNQEIIDPGDGKTIVTLTNNVCTNKKALNKGYALSYRVRGSDYGCYLDMENVKQMFFVATYGGQYNEISYSYKEINKATNAYNAKLRQEEQDTKNAGDWAVSDYFKNNPLPQYNYQTTPSTNQNMIRCIPAGSSMTCLTI